MLTKLLDFLVSNYYRVIALFSTLWDDLVSTVNNVWRWITDSAANVINWTQAQLASLSNWAAAQINAMMVWINWVKSDLWSIITSWAALQIYQARAEIMNEVNTIRLWVNGRIASINDFAVTYVTPLIQGVRDWVSSQLTTLSAAINTFIPYKAVLDFLSTTFTQDNRTKLLDFLQNGYKQLTTFIGNPVGFTFGVLWAGFIEFLSFSLAYALGSTKYQLPALPSWGETGGISPNPGGNGAPPGASGLSAPITPLYISGYTFGPSHPGTDYGLVNGQGVYACHSGEVIEAGYSSVGYGNTVVIQGSNWRTRYAHLLAVMVGVGQTVGHGQLIGEGDTTGNSTGPHLHFEAWYNNQAIDPVTLF